MSQTPPHLYSFTIQPPPTTPPSIPLVPPPTFILRETPTPDPSLTANNLMAVASLVPASIESAIADISGVSGDDLTGTLAVPATTLSDGSGVGFVFRNLRIERVGNWRIRVIVLRMSEGGANAGGMQNGIGRVEANAEGAIVGVELVSRVVSVSEEAEANEDISEYFPIFLEWFFLRTFLIGYAREVGARPMFLDTMD
ncbi:hypothetical protein VE01_02946 [Pseudogymnoascus verrucosus]|uniref:Velvet domain-containing protein n=1 Tax=Pseudogymnoascus verrucosus TaxID=342668 RepID=A0A1B8GUA8_9PEZI|nr:uncharacterized protein VE01_02946 [Pseudogymnoascus verrucosus]OBT99411.1 hypothetical protein VE01_02946 [Pseudogymnoascus verrucosus]